jgi:hypothetical protein
MIKVFHFYVVNFLVNTVKFFKHRVAQMKDIHVGFNIFMLWVFLIKEIE